MSIEAMKQALAKFEHLWEIGIDAEYKVELLPEIQTLRQAIEQAEKQEPNLRRGTVDRVKIITTLKWVHDLLQFNGITAPLEDLDDIIMMLKKESLADLIREKNT
jgi:hypothetical protein